MEGEEDVSCAFYRIRAPPGLEELFVLPSVRVKHLRKVGVEGLDHLGDEEELSPLLLALAMGFSWSLFFCQRLLESVARHAGFKDSQFVTDRERPPDISQGEVALAIYVDGIGVLSSCPERVKAARALLRKSMFEHHLDPGEADEEEQIFIGLNFGRYSGRVAVRSDKLWHIRYAIGEVLRRRKVSGDQLRKLVGHVTWAMLPRREALCLLAATYRFMELAGDQESTV